jgi:arylsulfatase A-like enzyme
MRDNQNKQQPIPTGFGKTQRLRVAPWAALILLCSLPLLFIVPGCQWESKDAASTAHIGNIRRPIHGEVEAFQTVPAAQILDGSGVTFDVRMKGTARIEVGVIRTGTENSGDREYVFSVHELTDKGKRTLLETSAEFPTDSLALFRPTAELKAASDDVVKIRYTLKPKGVAAKVGSLIGRLRGKSYYQDFAFSRPSLLYKAKRSEPNIILISLDTLRADRLGVMGYPRATTPNLDAFSRRAILFTQAITPSPWTTTAHFSLFSAVYPSAHVREASLMEAQFSYANRFLPSVLRDNGYYSIGITAGAGISSSYGFSEGFNRYLEFNSMNNAEDPEAPWDHEDGTAKIFDNAMDWLESNRDTKFFMFLHNYECHDPYEDTYFLDQGDKGSFIEQRRALYDGDVRKTDAFFGRLIEKLESLDMLSNTAVIVVSDHGEDLGDHFNEEDRIPPKFSIDVPQISNADHGHSVYDEVVRIPMIMHFPGIQPKKAVLDNQVRLIDVMPTILDYLDMEYDGPLQGTSLLPLMETGEREVDPPALSEYTGHGPEQKSLRMNGYKYIYVKNPSQIKYGITFRNIPKMALFDLKKDPGEKNNIYAENKELAMEYHQVLEEILRESAAINNDVRKKNQAGERKSEKPPEDVIKSLKALGYIQ